MSCVTAYYSDGTRPGWVVGGGAEGETFFQEGSIVAWSGGSEDSKYSIAHNTSVKAQTLYYSRVFRVHVSVHAPFPW